MLRREADVQLVLLDLMMPRLSGLDVLAQMRAQPQWQTVPCVILTAAGQDQQRELALRMGATDFMTKPFSPKKLYARVASSSASQPTMWWRCRVTPAMHGRLCSPAASDRGSGR